MVAPLSSAIESSDCASRTGAKRTVSPSEPSSPPSPTVLKPYTAGRGRLLYDHGVEK